VLRLDHVVLPVSNPAESLTFYREVLQLRLVDAFDGPDWGGFPWLMMIFATGDGREIVLVHFAGARRAPKDGLPKDARHVALSTSGRLDKWRKRLSRAKVAFWEEDHGAQQSLYCEDPNGYIVEITSPPSRPPRGENEVALANARRWIEKRGRKR
jgi:catechol 2,3-dioxygenase-like lactoylglutathione lyase family enzyme